MKGNHMKKILVPEGMFRFALHKFENYWENKPSAWNASQDKPEIVFQILVESLRYLSENPIVPTAEQKHYLLMHFSPMGVSNWDQAMWFNFIADCTVEWQKRMFLAPSDVARVDAAIPDLLIDAPTHITVSIANNNIREAYRRGRDSK